MQSKQNPFLFQKISQKHPYTNDHDLGTSHHTHQSR